MEDKPLRGDARLSVVDRPRRYGSLDRLVKICARHDDKGIASAQLQHSLFNRSARNGCHVPACPHASRQRYSFHARVFDDAFHGFDLDEQCLKGALRKTRPMKGLVDPESALRYVWGMLEKCNISRHQGCGGKSKCLPEWKIPRHDRKDRTERLVTDIA